jgi:hypothetical protein
MTVHFVIYLKNYKITKIDKLIERDERRGPQFTREEIESMMSDKHFANMYADFDQYKMQTNNLQLKRQMEALKDELFGF